MTKHNMTVGIAAGIFDAIGCGEDPITVHHRRANLAGEAVAHDLHNLQLLIDPHTAEYDSWELLASYISISFYGRDGKMVRGSVRDMVIDRLSDYRGFEHLRRADTPQPTSKMRKLGKKILDRVADGRVPSDS